MNNEYFNLKKNLVLILLVALFFLSFFYRLYGLSTHNPPFWVDEFTSANQGKTLLNYGFQVFTNPDIFFDHYNITTHTLIALSYKIFGINEFAARMPMVLIGSFIPLLTFAVARKIFDLPTGISSSLFIAFSYMQIAWSRQARGYIILEFLVLVSTWMYLKKLYLLLIFFIFLGILTHPLFYIFLIAMFIHFAFTQRGIFIALFKKPAIYLLIFSGLILIYKIGFILAIKNVFSGDLILTNNLWYYHSFFWREYGLISFLTTIGLLLALINRKKSVSFIVLYITLHLFFVSFIFKPYTSRYLLPIFPFFFIFTSYNLTQLPYIIKYHIDNGRARMAISLFLTLFIIANGYKFVNKPKKYYSVNHDFREIANIDYHEVYKIIKKKGDFDKGKTVVVETWWDRAAWYLNWEAKDIYLLRWKDGGYINGIPTKTRYEYNTQGERVLKNTDLKLVLDLSDLSKILKKCKKGFLFIDASSLPADVREYAEKNFKKELYLDRYPLEQNPYSVWPATLYSWGFN